MSELDDHFYKLMLELEEFHTVFYQIVEFGCRPIFTNDARQIDTACIRFNYSEGGGSRMSFMFNINFWNELNDTERKFLVCHEMLHVLFNHSPRFIKAFRDGEGDTDAINVGADLAINETLIDMFAFKREDMPIVSENLCFIDTVFKDYAPNVLRAQNSEYYFNLLKQNVVKINIKLLLNNHGHFTHDLSDLIKYLGEGMSQYDKDKLEKMMERHLGKGPGKGEKKINELDEEKKGKKQGGKPAGQNPGDIRYYACKYEKLKKVKWESVIRNWHDIQKRKLFDASNWASTDRRYTDILSRGDFILPGTREMQHDNKNRIKLFMFLDTSGSCAHLADRFFNVARTIDEAYFDLHLVCFDTKTYPTHVKTRELFGFGGTCFKVIPRYIAAQGKCRYAVFVVTDGWGSHPEIAIADRRKYHWFLTENYTKYIPEGCFTYDLRNFE